MVTRIEIIIYKYPEIITTDCLSSHKNIPQGPLASVMKIKKSIIGIKNIDIFFQTLNTCSEKMITTNKEADMNSGVIKKTGFKLYVK